MKKNILILPLLFCCFFSYAQKRKQKISSEYETPQQIAQEAKNHNCVLKNHFTVAQRRKKYPFSKAAKIQLISYLAQPGSDGPSYYLLHSGIPKEKDSVCINKLHEIATISNDEVDSLSSILLNVGFQGPTSSVIDFKCYEPRNGILFFDSKGKIFDYLEICFDCEKIYSRSGNIEIGDLCSQKFELLKALFSRSGIKFGITESD